MKVWVKEGDKYRRVTSYHGMKLDDVFEVIAITRDGKYAMVKVVGGEERYALGTDVIREHYEKSED